MNFRRRRLLIAYYIFQRRHRIRRHYIRPAHQRRLVHSFALLNRYYASADPADLEKFCAFTPTSFDALHNRLQAHLQHQPLHRRPITTQQRLVVFFAVTSLFNLNVVF